MLLQPHKQISMIAVGVLTVGVNAVFGQSTIYPKEIRGYKVERAAVELKQTKVKKPDTKIQTPSQASTSLIQFGNPRVVRITPLGISLEIPIVVSPATKRARRFSRL